VFPWIQKFKFDSHITSTVIKTISVLGFIRRWSIDLLLFTSLGRPNLEYCSSIWSPKYQEHIDRIESVQKQFLLFALRGLNWDQNVRLPFYPSRLQLINLPTLVNRKTMLGPIFMHNLIRAILIP